MPTRMCIPGAAALGVFHLRSAVRARTRLASPLAGGRAGPSARRRRPRVAWYSSAWRHKIVRRHTTRDEMSRESRDRRAGYVARSDGPAPQQHHSDPSRRGSLWATPGASPVQRVVRAIRGCVLNHLASGRRKTIPTRGRENRQPARTDRLRYPPRPRQLANTAMWGARREARKHGAPYLRTVSPRWGDSN